MDQVLTSDNDEVNDEYGSKCNSLVNPLEANFFESFSNAVDDGIGCDSNNEENRSPEKSSKSLVESENCTSPGENDVSSTSCAENEVIPNGDDSSVVVKNLICDTVKDFEKSYNSSGNELEIESCNQQPKGDINVDSNVNNTANELLSPTNNTPVSTLPCAIADTNADSSLKPNEVIDNVSNIQNVCDSCDDEAELINDEAPVKEHGDNFLPTIVEIRGGCIDALEKKSDRNSSNSLHDGVSSSTPPEIPSLNIVSVLGSCKDINSVNEISKTNVESNSPSTLNHDVHTISDSDETTVLNKCSENSFNSDITIKQEPHDSVLDNDCVYVGTEHCSTSFTSEIFIKEEKTSNAEGEQDPEVIYVETTLKIPLPIPIKMEPNIEAESQPSSSKIEKFTAKKRVTRSSSSKSDDCIVLSSSSDIDSVSDSRKRNRLPKNAPYSTAGYTCHLCNTVFQEHELLNEHMILHRNNSLIEAKVLNRSKMTKVKLYSCDICQKQLSTSQSLQQHVLIHKNEKPFVCHICQKDFRHLSNYRMHLQKHKAEQRRRNKMQLTNSQEQLDKSVVRGVDFGRLVGPLFMKESLLHQEQDTVSNTSTSLSSNATTSSVNSAKKTGFKSLYSTKDDATGSSVNSAKNTTFKSLYSTKDLPQRQSRLSFDQSPFKTKPNTTSSISSAAIIKRRRPSSDSISEEECVAVKSFNNIESVVMNASKIIVRLDNLDTSVLKRKLQTPDISIDQAPKKCRVMLSPIAEKCNIKLDEIENIPMDMDPGEIDLPPAEQMEDDSSDNYLNEVNDEEMVGSSVYPPHGTMTDNELFELLNDDKDTSTATTISFNSAGDGGSSSQIMQPKYCKVGDAVKASASPIIKRSNVIFVETPQSYEMSSYENEDTVFDDKLDDAFDTAFQKVATRRLALLQKRAAENAGKVESRYLLGPLFWRKALRRARNYMINAAAPVTGSSRKTNVDISFGSNSNGSYNSGTLRTWTGLGRFGGRSRFDDRRTNDPTKLQPRAENKFKCLLERAKMLNDLNGLNLAGPLFWRRTLQLAGIHRGEDLRTHMNVGSPVLEGVEFVGDDGKPCDTSVALVYTEQQKTPSPQTSLSDRVPAISTATSKSDDLQSNDQPPSNGNSPLITSDILADDVLKLSDEIQSSIVPIEQQPTSSDDAASKNISHDALKTDSILYESLTKPKENQLQQPSIKPDSSPPSVVDSASLFIANPETTVESSLGSDCKTELLKNYSTDSLNHKCKEVTDDAVVAVEDDSIAKLAPIDSGSIMLNVDGGGSLQLIHANSDQVAIPETGQNFVLVSDGSGNMQYMVNMPNENYTNFELIGDAVGGGGDQVAYAIQFDGENYTAVQFMQDGGGIQLQSDSGLKEAQLRVDSKAATYLVSNSSTTPPAVVSDPNHIGKELSDFLNLDYGNLLKNGPADQPIS